MKKLTLTLALLALAAPATASAAPVFNLDLHHNQTHFPPGGDQVTAEGSVNTQTEGSAGANERQGISLVANAGSFVLGFDPDGAGPAPAQFTADIPFGSPGATVQSALEALPAIGAGNVGVSATGDTSYTVTFQGALAATDVSQLTIADGASPLTILPEYWVDIANVGPDPTSGPITVTIALPSGITRHDAKVIHSFSTPYLGEVIPHGPWSCPGSPGDRTIVCTGTGSIPAHAISRGIAVIVNVAAPEGALRTLAAKVSGGGGAEATATEPTPISSTPAPFGIVAPSFAPDLFAADGLTPERQAGGHPELLTVPFDFNTIEFPAGRGVQDKLATGSIRNLRVDTPPGFLGAPAAVGECPQANLLLADCPLSSQVGRLDVATTGIGTSSLAQWQVPVYNLVHPFGISSDLAAVFAGNPAHIRASLDPANGYAITTYVPNVNETLPIFDQRLTLWGTPADPSHDFERCGTLGDTSRGCPSDIEPKPFLTAPFECGVEKSWRLHHYDSWQRTGDFGPDIAYTMPGPFRDCDRVPFRPTISLAPTTDAADSHSGLDVTIELPQDTDPEIATSPLKDATVTLPEGITVNPASANGLDACTPAQISLGTDEAIRCPDSARVADVHVETPLLPDPIEGTVYLAAPHENPFDTLLAGYIVLSDPDRGLLVKIPGRIDLDKDTGQITGTFTDNPQLPFSRFELHFKGGAHSTLITPKTCGTYTSNATFAPWSGNPAVEPTSDFTIARGTGGAPCAGSEAALPNSPSFDAGPLSPVAGNHSPFVVNLRRADGSQRFSAVTVRPPPGLVAKLAGTELCPAGALAAAAAKRGVDEQTSPSCPLGSKIGSAHAAAGAGPSPYWAPATAYLSGPYKGAPLSMAVIAPAVAGPFDLGTIVNRVALHVDPKTAEITAVSDPLPRILEGVPLNIRQVSVHLDKPDFTLTGTSCNPSSVNGLLTSTLGAVAPLSVRYQLSDCRRLPFKPRTTLRLRGGTKRGAHPALTINLMPRPGDANISFLQIAFPRSEFLENAHIRTICTRPDFAADACPRGAVYGRASVTTPLLDYPLTGNVYLRSSDNLLPDVVPDLRGPSFQPIRLESAGRTDSIKGGIRNTIDFVPDAPFTKATVALQGGNKGLLVNSRDICARAYRAVVRYRAHNGRAYVERPKMRVKCKKKGKRGGHKRGKRGAKQSAVARRSAVK